ncbi:MAG: zinc ABC transporter ATP-binding protein ZnuC [Gammaproteobacteria bacterium]|nr:zinc ABC transporter ATP-binding protein ZnuC [Gammaproteobacteria bacterium]
MSNPPVLIQVNGVSLTLGGRTILKQIDLSVRRGEVVAVIGPNGAGKSTLIRIILGLIKADYGSVSLPPDTRIGYMPQRLRIDPALPLTVRRFLTLGQRCNNETLRRACAETGVERLIDAPIQSLSGGENQRVLLTRALLRKPQLLILDEPAQGVDIQGQAELYSLINTIRHRYQCGVLMISHDLHLVMATTDRVLCLNQHICCSGHPETVSQDPAYLALFGNHPGLALYTHRHDHQHDIHGAVVDSCTTCPKRPDAEHPHG